MPTVNVSEEAKAMILDEKGRLQLGKDHNVSMAMAVDSLLGIAES